VSRYWLHQGLDYVRSHPFQDLQLTGRKILLFFNNYEIPDNHNYYFHQRYSPVLRILPVSFGMVAPFLLLGLLGMLFSGRTGPRFCFLIQVIYTASVILFYVFSRYRMVILPLFCLTAGYGLFMLQDQFTRARWRQLVLNLLVVILGFGVANLKVIDSFDFSHTFTDEGIAYELKEKQEKAIASYRQALAVNPDYLRALERMGQLQLQQEDYEGARITYEKILSIDPESVEAKYQLMLLDKLGL
jgi:tetratricopeptide (TPR) repeat protein